MSGGDSVGASGRQATRSATRGARVEVRGRPSGGGHEAGGHWGGGR